MASVKVKFRKSVNKNAFGTVYLQVIHQREVRLINTDLKIHSYEWNDENGCILTNVMSERYFDLLVYSQRMKYYVYQVEQAVFSLYQYRCKFECRDIINEYERRVSTLSIFSYMENLIEKLISKSRIRTAETYYCAFKSFGQYANGKNIQLNAVNSFVMKDYETFLKSRGLSKNTISFYMRILRAAYNKAVDEGLINNVYPFRKVYTGVPKTSKRAIGLRDVKLISSCEINGSPSMTYARDIFLFLLYARGMSFIDAAYLKKDSIQNGVLTYKRHKTGQILHIKWEPQMQEIVNRHSNAASQYLLNILNEWNGDVRVQYKNKLSNINRSLKKLGKYIGIQLPLTTYVSRHTWASIARDMNVPIEIISKGMGHDSIITTQIYLSTVSEKIVDDANALILDNLS